MTPEEYLKKYPSETRADLIERGKEFSKQEYEDKKAKQAARIVAGREPSLTFQHVIDIYEATH